MRAIKIILLTIFIGATLIMYQEPLRQLYTRINARLFPCTQPITYNIDRLDAQFHLSRIEYLKVIQQAETIWEKSIGKDLFSYSTSSSRLQINLIYDYRQEATEKLIDLGLKVDESRASHDVLKSKLVILRKHYEEDRAMLEAKITAYESRLSALNAAVQKWNRSKSGTRTEYEQLQNENAALDLAVMEITNFQATVNAEAETINALVVTLNRLAASLNLHVTTYNDIGSSQGEEFEEGTYTSGGGEERIDIYQFDNRAKLLRVLTHELGHALSLDHLDNPKAIMYRLNSGMNSDLTLDDITALKKRCGIK